MGKVVRVVGGGIAVLFGLGLIGAVMDPPKDSASAVDSSTLASPAASAPAAATSTEPQLMEVDAPTLHAEYAANEIAADREFKGKRFRLTGRITSIDKDVLGNSILSLETGSEVNAVLATLHKSAVDSAAQLARGDQVVLVCEGGGRILGSASALGCRWR